MIDEMSIKKHTEWDGYNLVGYVDIGNGVIDDSSPPATEALVCMVVCVNGSWKVPKERGDVPNFEANVRRARNPLGHCATQQFIGNLTYA